MKRYLFTSMLLLAASIGCARDKPATSAQAPYAAQQSAARDEVARRGRYDVRHDPNDTMSVNSMGSD